MNFPPAFVASIGYGLKAPQTVRDKHDVRHFITFRLRDTSGYMWVLTSTDIGPSQSSCSDVSHTPFGGDFVLVWITHYPRCTLLLRHRTLDAKRAAGGRCQARRWDCMMCTDDGDGGIDAIVSMMPLLIGYRRPHLLPSRRSSALSTIRWCRWSAVDWYHLVSSGRYHCLWWYRRSTLPADAGVIVEHGILAGWWGVRTSKTPNSTSWRCFLQSLCNPSR